MVSTYRILIFVLAIGACRSQIPSKCTIAGSINCDTSCHNVVVCLGDNEGGFREEIVEECNPFPEPDTETATFCYLPLKTCSSKNTCTFATPKFQCTSLGMFPDPYDCTFYYFCVQNPDPEPNPDAIIGVHSQCEDGYAFNADRGICNFKLDNAVCLDGPVPECVEIGQSGPLDQNKSMYYICKKKDSLLYPVLFVCPRGGIFNDVMKECDELLVSRRQLFESAMFGNRK